MKAFASLRALNQGNDQNLLRLHTTKYVAKYTVDYIVESKDIETVKTDNKNGKLKVAGIDNGRKSKGIGSAST